VTRVGRNATAVAGIVAVATALTGASALGSLGSRQETAKDGFALRGHVGGLYPGARKKLTIVVHNGTARPLRVRSIRTRVRDASRKCRARNVRVAPYRGSLRLRPHQWRRVTVRVRMLRSAPSTCQKKTFRLEFHGTATH
jgi:hypothetical protein